MFNARIERFTIENGLGEASKGVSLTTSPALQGETRISPTSMRSLPDVSSLVKSPAESIGRVFTSNLGRGFNFGASGSLACASLLQGNFAGVVAWGAVTALCLATIGPDGV